MTPRGRGRPSRGAEAVSPVAILSEALNILDGEGLERLTMRALATRLGINPMTIYYHFNDRDGLIKAMADKTYADVSVPAQGDARTRIIGLLNAYRAKVVRHPALTLAIFNRPAIFPDHAARITADLAGLLGELDLSPARVTLWVHILVDYTHGAALAVAMNGEHYSGEGSSAEELDESYRQGVCELLHSLQ